MKAENVVVHYRDGRLLKGSVLDFNPPAIVFHLRPFDSQPDAAPIRVDITELKAVFFVRDLTGNSRYVYRQEFKKDRPPVGRRVKVTFGDGEVLVGWTTNLGEPGDNFFLFPADTQGNMLRVFVVGTHVREIIPL